MKQYAVRSARSIEVFALDEPVQSTFFVTVRKWKNNGENKKTMESVQKKSNLFFGVPFVWKPLEEPKYRNIYH